MMLHVGDDIQYCFRNVVRLPQSDCQREKISYAFKNAQITVVNPSFADDITLAASDASDCQQSISAVQEIVTWTKTMAFKPSKCRSWAGRFFRNGEKTKFTKLQNSTYSFYDPALIYKI